MINGYVCENGCCEVDQKSPVIGKNPAVWVINGNRYVGLDEVYESGMFQGAPSTIARKLRMGYCLLMTAEDLRALHRVTGVRVNEPRKPILDHNLFHQFQKLPVPQ